MSRVLLVAVVACLAVGTSASALPERYACSPEKGDYTCLHFNENWQLGIASNDGLPQWAYCASPWDSPILNSYRYCSGVESGVQGMVPESEPVDLGLPEGLRQVIVAGGELSNMFLFSESADMTVVQPLISDMMVACLGRTPNGARVVEEAATALRDTDAFRGLDQEQKERGAKLITAIRAFADRVSPAE